ncbi:unnamed protein product [Boreogadus saida]
MWGQEDHSHWRSLIHQPQTAELSRSSGGRGSDELRRRDQQDVRISILREVAVGVMITSESSSIYPMTDVLHQAGPSARQLQQHGSSISSCSSTAPPSALSARLLHQHSSSRHGFLLWLQTVALGSKSTWDATHPPPASEVHL